MSGGRWQHREVLAQPAVLAAGTASCVFAAVEAAHQVLSMSELNSLAQRTLSFVLYYERPDAAMSNQRMMANKLSLAGDRLLYIPGFCTAHALQRAFEHTLREKAITGDIFLNTNLR